MFNLLMRFSAFKPGREVLSLPRVFECTTDPVKAAFMKDGQIDFDGLIRLPCLFMEEGTDHQQAYVGWIRNAQVVGSEVHFEFWLDPETPPITNSIIYQHKLDFHMPTEFEFHRGHWAVKDTDLFRMVLRHARSDRRPPTVFKIPKHETIDNHLVSVMMPFGESFDKVYEAIGSSIADFPFYKCLRADDIWIAPEVIQDVVALIDQSRVVIADCTGKNANVFYEIGIAHTLGREVILITQNPSDIPFDLQRLRYLHYLNNDEGRGRLREALKSRLITILNP